jgi:hypothetical protein
MAICASFLNSGESSSKFIGSSPPFAHPDAVHLAEIDPAFSADRHVPANNSSSRGYTLLTMASPSCVGTAIGGLIILITNAASVELS